MLKRIYIALAFVFISTFSMGQAYHSPIDQVDHSMTINSLGTTNFTAFANRGQEKIEDFYNYLEIISNGSLNNKLREHAADMVQKMFTETSSNVTFASDSSSVKELVELLLASKKEALEVELEFGEFNGGVLFIPNGKDKYTGTYNVTVKQNGTSVTRMIDVVLKRSAKNFGSETQVVWEVLLDKIQ